MNPKGYGHITEKEWLEDFRDFVSSESTSVPEKLSQKILHSVHRSLNPSAWGVFFKLLGLHSIVGTLSLAICNQFGMSPFNTEISLSEYFMRFGHSACMFLCGFLFLSLTVLSVRAVFRAEEFRVLKKNVWLQIPFLSLLSIAVFLGLGEGILFSIAAYWFVGAVLGGLLSTLIGGRLAHAL